MQVTVACAAACARKSALDGIPQHFIAGREECIVVAARDAFGCATEGNDTVCLTLDHAAEGPQDLDVKVRFEMWPAHACLTLSFGVLVLHCSNTSLLYSDCEAPIPWRGT